MQQVLRALVAAPFVAALALLPTACSGGGGSGGGLSFAVFPTGHAIDANGFFTVGGIFVIYLADEATSGALGTDINGDGDMLDDCAILVNATNNVTVDLAVAAKSAFVVSGTDVYVVVDEAEDGGTDYDGDDGAGLGDDIVLLNWNSVSGLLTYVATIDAGTDFLALTVIGTRLYYTRADVPLYAALAGDETSLHYVDAAAPLTEVQVLNTAGMGTLRPHILDDVEGLIFLALDETETGANYNPGAPGADVDALDLVLALLDGTDITALVASTGLAVPSLDVPFDACNIGPCDWLVGFLVSETDQDAQNLNDPALFANPLVPDSCVGTPDVDTLDDVLFYLHYANFVATTEPPTNTGLAGRDRVRTIASYVATISDEADATCDMNEDGDSVDSVARWIDDSLLVAPQRDASQLHALTNVPGGSMGLANVGNYFVAVVDELADGRNHDGKVLNNDLVALLDPSQPIPLWDFSHASATNPNHGTGLAGEPFAGTGWMAEDEQLGRIGIAFEEAVPLLDLNNNVDCGFQVKDTPPDTADSLPTWADVEAGPTLDLDGLGYAIDADNAGIVLADVNVYFRVFEGADNVDYNGDGDKNDYILMRNPIVSCAPVAMATAHNLPEPIIETDGLVAGAFRSSEFAAGGDLNGDGDANDVVIRYFRYK